MFNYDKEKEKLDRDLELGRIDEKKYTFAIEQLNEASTKITQLKADLDAGRVDGKNYNFRELEIIRAYDAALSQKKHAAENRKKIARNVISMTLAIVFLLAAIITTLIARNNYLHRSIDNIPDPIQTALSSGEQISKDVESEYAKVHIRYMAKYSIDGLVISKEVSRANSAREAAAPYVFGLAWGYAAAHNSNITWSYAGRNTKAVEYGDLDRLKILHDSSTNELIPADEEIAKQLQKFYLGDRLVIEGYLVEVTTSTGIDEYVGLSSLVRGDEISGLAGAGTANEIIYVTSVSPVY